VECHTEAHGLRVRGPHAVRAVNDFLEVRGREVDANLLHTFDARGLEGFGHAGRQTTECVVDVGGVRVLLEVRNHRLRHLAGAEVVEGHRDDVEGAGLAVLGEAGLQGIFFGDEDREVTDVHHDDLRGGCRVSGDPGSDAVCVLRDRRGIADRRDGALVDGLGGVRNGELHALGTCSVVLLLEESNRRTGDGDVVSTPVDGLLHRRCGLEALAVDDLQLPAECIGEQLCVFADFGTRRKFAGNPCDLLGGCGLGETNSDRNFGRNLTNFVDVGLSGCDFVAAGSCRIGRSSGVASRRGVGGGSGVSGCGGVFAARAVVVAAGGGKEAESKHGRSNPTGSLAH